ncbi:MAG: excalibur calcium-binding domain-containing protein [Halothiobacillaceae bacterium]|nr:excalibur calcium-binding domain-containing protein [Halothiobacillaceae bacterium]
MKTYSFAVLTLAMLGTSFPAMAAIFKCPTPSGVFEYGSIPCANGFRKEGGQWVDIATEKKQRIEMAKERQQRLENESKPQEPATEIDPAIGVATPTHPENTVPVSPPSPFRCDGRTHCSQMTSCDEAKYFLKNCPNVQMDGENDGIPCEKQWCNGTIDSITPTSAGRR